MTLIVITNDEIDNALGTASAQKIFRLLSSWGTLSLKDLQEKSSISESQLHLILQRMVKAKILHKEARGIYSLYSSPFVSRLSDAYLEQTKHSISHHIYQIHQYYKKKDYTQAEKLFQELEKLYKPVLKKFFSQQVSGLVHQLLEKYEV